MAGTSRSNQDPNRPLTLGDLQSFQKGMNPQQQGSNVVPQDWLNPPPVNQFNQQSFYSQFMPMGGYNSPYSGMSYGTPFFGNPFGSYGMGYGNFQSNAQAQQAQNPPAASPEGTSQPQQFQTMPYPMSRQMMRPMPSYGAFGGYGGGYGGGYNPYMMGMRQGMMGWGGFF